MSTDRLEIKFCCEKCGATVIELPDDYTDDSAAKCKGCGVEHGRWGDIKAQAMNAAKVRLSGMVKDAFKGIKGITIK